ncbi:MAG: winged helix-turn-helix transcriptional regulator [Elusimicrobia bacterium]|nr:winged helix-turn-helix transcriptional regulator [Elusimicrobiota bacterium]
MKAFMQVAKALADENRVRILMSLDSGELCVCQVIHLLRLAPSTVSKHISILYQAGLVDSRKTGRWVHYRIADKGAAPTVSAAIRWVRRCVERAPGVAEDRRRLKAIRAMDLRRLCAAYPAQALAAPGSRR